MKTSLFKLRHCNLHGMFYHELYYCRFFSQIVWYEVLVCNHVISRQCWGSIEFFFSVNLHYSRVLISSQKREMLLLLTTNMAAVTSRANHQRHQLRINKAANSSRAPTRQSNFCHSNNYLLFIPPRFWLPDVESHVPAATKDQGSFAKQERQPWERGWSTSNCNRESIHGTPLVDFRISWYMYASASYPDVSLSRWKRARKGRREGDNGRDSFRLFLRLPSVPLPWSLAIHHQSLAFRARLYHAKNEAPEEGAVYG